MYYQDPMLTATTIFGEQLVIFMKLGKKNIVLYVDHVILICYWISIRTILGAPG